MARKTDIRLRRSATAGNAPSTSDLNTGEIALNTDDGALFYKRTTGGADSIVVAADARTLNLDYTNQKVGIKNASPSDELHVAGVIRTHTSATSKYIRLFGGNSGNFLDSYGNTLFLRPAGSTANSTRLDSSGNLMVAGRLAAGTTLPETKLHIANGSDSTAAVTITGGHVGRRLKIQSFQNNSLDGAGFIFNADSSNGAFKFQTTSTDRLVITSDGKVGIGIGTPGDKLHVYDGNIQIQTPSGSGGRYISLNNTHTGGRDYRLISTNDSHGSLGGGDFAILDNDVSGNDAAKTRLLIDNSGNVGIGTTHPDSKLDVTGGDITVNTTGTGFMNFKYNNSSKGTIGTDGIDLKITAAADLQLLPVGNVGIGTSTPTEILTLDDTDPKLALRDAGTERAFLQVDSANNFVINNKSISSMIFKTSDAERMRIDGSGNLCINNTGGSAKLDIRTDDGYGLRLESGSGQYFRVAHGGNTEIAGDVVVAGTIDINSDGGQLQFGADNDMQIFHNGAVGEINNATGNFQIDSVGDIILDAGGQNWFFDDDGLRVFSISQVASDVYLGSEVADKDIFFRGKDGSSAITALTLDMSDAGSAIFNHDIKLGDNGIAKFGAGNDLQVYHDGSNSYINGLGDGNIIIRNSTDDADISFQSDDGSGSIATYFQLDGSQVQLKVHKDMLFFDSVKANFGSNADLQIYHNASDSYIENATGNLEIRNNTDDGDINFRSDNGSGGLTTYFSIDGGDVVNRFYKDAYFTDNVKAKFGNSSDLQIFHDGSNSYIKDQGDGQLILDGNGVILQYSAGTKLQTTNTGVSVTGNLTISGDLTVNGTNTIINTATLDVEDKNITINKGSGDTSGSADGAGITIQDAVDANTDASLTWRAADDKFIFSHPLRMFGQFELPDNVKLVAGDSEDLQIFHDGAHSEIREQGNGDLRIRGDSVWVIASSGANQISAAGGVVKLYCSGTERLATTSTGINVTGTGTFTGGELFLGTANTSSGHINALENMTFNIDTDNDDTNRYFEWNTNGNSSAGTELMRLQEDGTLYLGANTPVLHNAHRGIIFENGSLTNDVTRGASKSLNLAQNAVVDAGNTWAYLATDEASLFQQFQGDHYFYTAPAGNGGSDISFTARMIVKRAGGVLIGKTSANIATDGVELGTRVESTADGTYPLRLNRRNSDGDIINLRKDGSPVGVIGVAASDNIYFAGSTGSTKGIYINDAGIIPANTGGDVIDNAVDLGATGFRFKDLHLSNNINLGDSSSSPVFTLNKATTGSARIDFDNAGNIKARIELDSAENLQFKTGGTPTERLEITETGVIKFNNAYTFPTADGSAGQVLKTNGSGALSFQNDSGGGGSSNSITDADADTKIQVEESSDEDVIRMDTGGAERVQVTSNGLNVVSSGGYRIAGTEVITSARSLININNVGIGTASPSYQLHVAGGGDLLVEDTGGGSAHIRLMSTGSGTTTSHYKFKTNAANTFFIDNDTQSTSALTILANGKLGIGTTAPATKLEVKSGGSDDGIQVINSGSTNVLGGLIQTGTGDGALVVRNTSNAQTVLFRGQGNNYITGGNVGIGTTSPSQKLEVHGNIFANVSNGQGLLVTSVSGLVRNNATGIALRTNSTDKLTVTSAGNVGIGIDSPATTLHIKGPTVIGGTAMRIDNGFGESPKTIEFANGSTEVAKLIAFGRNNTSLNPYFAIEVNGTTSAGGTTTTSEKLRILSGGNVGIGTTTPAVKLHVSGGTDANLHLRSESQRSGAMIMKPGTNSIMGSVLVLADESYRLGTASNYHIRMNQNGQTILNESGNKVGIGDTNPAHHLTVSSPNNTTAVGIDIGSNAHFDFQANSTSGYTTTFYMDNTGLEIGHDSTSRNLALQTGNTDRLVIAGNGNVGIGTSSPAAKLHISGNSDVSDEDCQLIIDDVDGSAGSRIPSIQFRSVTGGTTTNQGRIRATDSQGMVISASAAQGDDLVVTASGVGIGTDSPNSYTNQKTLTINGTTHSRVDFETGGTLRGNIHADSGSLNVDAGGNYIRFFTGNTEKMRLKSNGFLGIGTQSPVDLLHIKSTSTDARQVIDGHTGFDAELKFAENGTVKYTIGHDAASDNFIIGTTNVDTQKRFVINSSGNVGISATSPVAKLQVEVLGIETNQSSVASTNQFECEAMSASTFRSARYTIQITNVTDSTYQVTEILLIHDGTTPSITQYGTVFTGSAREATFDADINSGNVRLLATPASSDSMQFKVVRHAILV